MAASYTFGPFRIDVSAEMLFRGAEPVPVGRRAVALLRALVERPGTPVSKDALIEAAWPGLAVEESNLTVQISVLRRVLGEEPGADRWIETLPRRGYRFTGPSVTSDEPAVAMPSIPVPALPLPDKPSIAVLPFQNMSAAPDQDYFVDGMVEEIITALSRIKWLFVIDRNSTAGYKGTVNVRRVAHEVGVRYVLEGSVRRAGDRVRIAAQLIDAASGANLWAERFDRPLQDVFQLQDDIASSVAGVIEPTLEAAELRRSAYRPTTDLTTYDLFLRARAGLMTHEKQQILRAIDLLEQAIARDPDYASALSSAAIGHMVLDGNGWTSDRTRTRDEALRLAGRALRAARDDAVVLGDVAYVLGYLEPDIGPAITLMDRALELNPSFAIGWTRSGWLRLWAGQPDLAIEHFERALRLNPLRRSPATFGIATAHFFARRLDVAAGMLQVSLKEYPTWGPCLRLLAACYAHLGRLEDACEIVTKLMQVTPVLIPSTEHWRVPDQRQFYLDGLRRAAGAAE